MAVRRDREPFRGLGLVSLGVAWTVYAIVDGVPWFMVASGGLIAFGLWDWWQRRRIEKR